MTDYYSVLGIPKGSKIEEIKKAYRRKAKEFHPDRNKSANAQEKFIEISEAYEVLVNGKPSIKKFPISPKSAYDKYKNVYSAPSDPHEYQEWLKAVRERAWRESGMTYEEFLKANKERLKSERRSNIYGILIAVGIIGTLFVLVFTRQWEIFFGLVIASFIFGILSRVYDVIYEIVRAIRK
jgi:curved DNA-binding protein CbpA